MTVLLVNDWWLKSAHPGFVTGKLSDFAGLLLVGLPLLAVWPVHGRTICLALALTFTWWKSPFSDSFIQFVNSYAPVAIGRTVDYSDLVALVTLPACCYLVEHGRRFALPWPALRKVLFLPLVAATAFVTMATSVIPTRQDYEIRQTSSAEDLRRDRVHEAIASVAKRHGLTCKDCPLPDGTMVYTGRNITMRYTFRSANTVAFAIEAWPGALFFGASGREKADALQSDIKDVLGERFQGLEFVQQLKPGNEYR